MLVAGLQEAGTVELKSQTVQAFDTYIQKAEARIDKGRVEGPFLWTDGTPVRKEHVRRGDIVAEPWSGNGDIEVTGGLIHDWIGAVFIPHTTLAKTLALVEDYNNHKRIYKPEVIDSQLLAHDGNNFRVRLRLLKKKVVTVVLNTEHDVRYVPLDQTRWSSRSYSTRIAEVESPGKPDEHELPPGNDHGFLWRLNSYWRFEERDGGVYVECEAISLTRGVPTGLGWLINPIIRSLPRESLANTLRATRDAAPK
jgi:hypothetical protein